MSLTRQVTKSGEGIIDPNPRARPALMASTAPGQPLLLTFCGATGLHTGSGFIIWWPPAFYPRLVLSDRSAVTGSLSSSLPDVGLAHSCASCSSFIACACQFRARQTNCHLCLLITQVTLQVKSGSVLVAIADTDDSNNDGPFTSSEHTAPIRKTRYFQKPSVQASLPGGVTWPLLQGILGKQVFSLGQLAARNLGNTNIFT